MDTVTDSSSAEKARPANAAYRAHLIDCDTCAGGHWCTLRERLDYIAAREDSRRG